MRHLTNNFKKYTFSNFFFLKNTNLLNKRYVVIWDFSLEQEKKSRFLFFINIPVLGGGGGWMRQFVAGSLTHPEIGASLLEEILVFAVASRSSLRGGVVKLALGLGPIHERCLGLGGWGDALLPSCGKLGDALPPGKVALRLWRLGNTASNSAHQRASSRLAAFTKVTLSGPVSAREWGCPVICSAPVTSKTLDMSTEPWGTVSGYNNKKGNDVVEEQKQIHIPQAIKFSIST